jgi:predicted RNA-binding Zn-ribbon protein involved in translation (DUF1610 family)
VASEVNMIGPSTRAGLMRLVVLGAFIFLLPAIAFSQGEGPALKAKFYEDFRKGDPKNAAMRPIRDSNFVWETGGARVLIPAGQGKIPTTGVSAAFQIKGDFEITASYEILKAEKPTDGYGVGVSMFVAINPDNDGKLAVSLSRRLMPKGNQQFLAHRMKPDAKDLFRTRPAKGNTGKLRVKRVGAMLSCFVADGDADFVPIYVDGKAKKMDFDFGADEIRYFQIGGDAGDSEAALDLRILDLTVHAEELPGLSASTPAKPGPPTPAPPNILQAPQSETPARNWTAIGGGIGAVVLLALIGGGAFFFIRRRKNVTNVAASSSAPGKKTNAQKATPAIPVDCECGRKLKIKPALAGKKIKCPDCGHSLIVPASAGAKNSPARPA